MLTHFRLHYNHPPKLDEFPSFYDEEMVYRDSWFEDKPKLIQEFLESDFNDKYIVIKNSITKERYMFANYLCANLIPEFKAKGSLIYIDILMQTFNETEIDAEAILREMVIQLHLFELSFLDTAKIDKGWAEEFKAMYGSPEIYIADALNFCRTEISEAEIAKSIIESNRRYDNYTSCTDFQVKKTP